MDCAHGALIPGDAQQKACQQARRRCQGRTAFWQYLRQIFCRCPDPEDPARCAQEGARFVGGERQAQLIALACSKPPTRLISVSCPRMC